ncbi:ATPase WRNIP1-like [Cimex lectularius]|uniref:AAA+ ATPase domain-containing protein n=1 Tax=Cimex lectularius TaxID=79782 RepID=A0A8I6RQJ5_CIMLE|nr:ATPase WRNIP1-like [Cimex lectularius]
MICLRKVISGDVIIARLSSQVLPSLHAVVLLNFEVFVLSSLLLTEMSSCPICNKEFPVGNIEAHVEKCLFLNSKAESKRLSCDDFDLARSPPSAKKQKTNPAFSPVPSTSKKVPKCETEKPLAEKMRPNSIEEYVGQEHLLGNNKALRKLLEKNNIPSMILWGPPGCGKTTLAHIIHKKCQASADYKFVKLSATLAGVNNVKEIVEVAKNDLKMFKKKTILFMDEIHRFNKLQQDIFLPNVESGLITLIGATTENPSFSLNNALLSRCRVFVLEKLNGQEIEKILLRAAESLNVVLYEENGTNSSDSDKCQMSSESIKWLSEMCDGDARIALNSLQLALDSRNSSENKQVTLDDIKDGIKKSHLLYDRKGEEHYNIISALHKSIRASDENAALYWLTRMLEGGEDPLFVARRLVRAASEDIGLADPIAITLAVSAMHGCQLIGMPECDVLLAQTAIYLARARKSQRAYRALLNAKCCIKNHKGPLPSVPLHLRNAPTKLMRDLGYANGYNMRHKDESGLTYMPEGLEDVNFFEGIPDVVDFIEEEYNSNED